jgi:hypothetical protein
MGYRRRSRGACRCWRPGAHADGEVTSATQSPVLKTRIFVASS